MASSMNAEGDLGRFSLYPDEMTALNIAECKTSSVSLCVSRKAVARGCGGPPDKVHPRNSAVASRQSTILARYADRGPGRVVVPNVAATMQQVGSLDGCGSGHGVTSGASQQGHGRPRA